MHFFIGIEGNMVARPENQNVARGCPNTETVDNLLYYIIDLYPEWYNHTHVSFKRIVPTILVLKLNNFFSIKRLKYR